MDAINLVSVFVDKIKDIEVLETIKDRRGPYQPDESWSM